MQVATLHENFITVVLLIDAFAPGIRRRRTVNWAALVATATHKSGVQLFLGA